MKRRLSDGRGVLPAGFEVTLYRDFGPLFRETQAGRNDVLVIGVPRQPGTRGAPGSGPQDIGLETRMRRAGLATAAYVPGLTETRHSASPAPKRSHLPDAEGLASTARQHTRALLEGLFTSVEGSGRIVRGLQHLAGADPQCDGHPVPMVFLLEPSATWPELIAGDWHYRPLRAAPLAVLSWASVDERDSVHSASAHASVLAAACHRLAGRALTYELMDVLWHRLGLVIETWDDGTRIRLHGESRSRHDVNRACLGALVSVFEAPHLYARDAEIIQAVWRGIWRAKPAGGPSSQDRLSQREQRRTSAAMRDFLSAAGIAPLRVVRRIARLAHTVPLLASMHPRMSIDDVLATHGWSSRSAFARACSLVGTTPAPLRAGVWMPMLLTQLVAQLLPWPPAITPAQRHEPGSRYGLDPV